MKSRPGTRWIRCLFGVAAAGALAVSATALASIPGSDGAIHACYTKSGGALRVVDLDKDACGPKETLLGWNTQGLEGPAGTPGAPGLSGLEVVMATSDSSSATLAAVTASCPAGKHVLGGGAVASGQFVDTPFTLIGSRP